MEKAFVISRTQNQVVIVCPYCGGKHYHGKDSIGGHVLAHCDGNYGYEVVDEIKISAIKDVVDRLEKDFAKKAVLDRFRELLKRVALDGVVTNTHE